MIAHKPMYGLQATFFSELFGTRPRYSRASIAKTLLAFVGAVLYAITIVSTHTWLR
jgi:CDP-diglyceride synthetase